jgi:hypothetical protein
MTGVEILKNGHGGKRAGAGKPKGTKNAATISKEQAREVVRQAVIAALQPLLAAQIANAQGLKYLVARDGKTGKFTRVTAAMAGSLKGDEVIEVWEKDPQVQAFTDLLNRALDKPAEQEQAVNVSGVLKILHEFPA